MSAENRPRDPLSVDSRAVPARPVPSTHGYPRSGAEHPIRRPLVLVCDQATLPAARALAGVLRRLGYRVIVRHAEIGSMGPALLANGAIAPKHLPDDAPAELHVLWSRLTGYSERLSAAVRMIAPGDGAQPTVEPVDPSPR